MITINLTPDEIRILTKPTRIEEWGAQQKVARKVQSQVLALGGESAMLDAFDIDYINKAIEVNCEGAFIALPNLRTGGWAVDEWAQSTKLLKAAVT